MPFVHYLSSLKILYSKPRSQLIFDKPLNRLVKPGLPDGALIGDLVPNDGRKYSRKHHRDDSGCVGTDIDSHSHICCCLLGFHRTSATSQKPSPLKIDLAINLSLSLSKGLIRFAKSSNLTCLLPLFGFSPVSFHY
jgi:hypothetical protein